MDIVRWVEFFKFSKNRIEFLVTIFLFVLMLILYLTFLSYIETRAGISFDDKLLLFIGPYDLTYFIFTVMYLSGIIFIFWAFSKVEIIILGIKSYIILIIFRIAALYFLPLEEPLTSIHLNDPFVQLFTSGELLTNDLFFSGHTATMFLFYLLAGKTKLRFIFIASTILVGLGVLIQHVHYTIDVVSAPFFTYASFKLALKKKTLR